jgi:hypothetical protein
MSETTKIIGIDVPLKPFTPWEKEQLIRAKHESGMLEKEKERLGNDNLALEINLDRQLLIVMVNDYNHKIAGLGEDRLSPEEASEYNQKIKELDAQVNQKQVILNQRNQTQELEDIDINRSWRLRWVNRVIAPTIKYEDFCNSLQPEDEDNIYKLWDSKLFFERA